MSPSIDMQVAIGLVEDGTQTRAIVTLDLAGTHFEGLGLARRSPGDPSMPEVGEELAISRALADLSHKLLDAATERIEAAGR